TGQTTVAAGTTTTYNPFSIEVFKLDGAANATSLPGDVLNVTSMMTGTAVPPAGTLTTPTLRLDYQNFETVTVVSRPTAVDDTAAVNEDASVVIDVLANDTVANVPATLALVSLPANGSATVLAANDPTNPFGIFFLGANGHQAIRYTPNPNFPVGAASATDAFAYRVTDANGQTNPLPDPTVTVTVNAVNDAPVNTVPGAQTTNEDTPLPIAGITVADVDFPAAGPQTLTVTLSVPAAAGTLDATPAGAATVGGRNTATLTVSGTPADINATLGTLIYTPAADFNGGTALTVATDDNGNIGIGGPLTDTDTVPITVVAVNDPPTVSVPEPITLDEDTSFVFGSDIVVSDAADGNAGSGTVTLTALHGTLTLGTVAGLTGVSGNGTGTVSFTGPWANLNAALTGLTYTPILNYNGSDTLSVSVNDNGNTGTGGALSASATVAITVNPVNDAPVAN